VRLEREFIEPMIEKIEQSAALRAAI